MTSTTAIKHPESLLKCVGSFVFRGFLGEGAFSSVYLTYDLETCDYYACKVIPKKNLSHHSNAKSIVKNEVSIWKKVSHQSIVKLISFQEDDENYYMFLEYCPNGDLFNLITQTSHIRESQAQKIVKSIVDALHVLHSNNIAHRDLKPENILFDKFGNAKLTDFGLSVDLEDKILTSTPCGSIGYTAPECIQRKIYDAKKCDMWLLGVVVYAVVAQRLPWKSENPTILLHEIFSTKPPMPSGISNECRNFISSLMKIDPKQRMTIDDCLKHPWIQSSIKTTAQSGLHQYASTNERTSITLRGNINIHEKHSKASKNNKLNKNVKHNVQSLSPKRFLGLCDKVANHKINYRKRGNVGDLGIKNESNVFNQDNKKIKFRFPIFSKK
ncbi:Calcium/calmodulin-dependent protein kinase type 1D [Tritrichomonas foetus]|uniref:Calcium/calmodulin-dependent protein kinase type 1D n=1 Tax=Tritrichomonas foetus TaxID=1144522 RepID=A0A1J4J9N0_9EUKA|nr:Calcium/calmodulin-dependent protein kinase type 1D [Tritrichomonas foetus]|eukprot:OHS95864.1 Calcium/calmodulin-dependent protein kinase type 1D [Tritrichomonas foetus]